MNDATLSVWIRRDDDSLALRFEVDGARAMLRVPEDGVLVDGPAVSASEERDLSPAALRGSRLMLIAPGGRQSIALDRISEDELAALPQGAWLPLERHTHKAQAWLEIEPPGPHTIEASEPDTEPTQASLSDLPPTSIGFDVAPPPQVDGALLEGSALVRHLRRSLSRERMRAYALEQRVSHLEALLAQAGLPLPEAQPLLNDPPPPHGDPSPR